MSVAIKIENVSKLYRLGTVGTGTISHDLNRWWHTIRGKEDPYAKVGQVNDRTKSAKSKVVSQQSSANAAAENCQLTTDDSREAGPDYVWALKDIDFEAQQGEILGIIGRNGAGKSTLLKLLSRVTAPTTGSIKTKGRIASLLEVGTGFHPELTGRENIYLNGAILGMKRHEIARRLDEIVEFSGCAKYLDTPVKRYSSGMMVRLGFAVAAHLECEILIIDEVLAVGDLEFQSRCIGKMSEIGRNGRTILFVSHNLGMVEAICSKAIRMHHGRNACIEEVTTAIGDYLQKDQSDRKLLREDDLDNGYQIHLQDAKINQKCGMPLQFNVAITSPDEIAEPVLGLVIFDIYGTAITGMSSRLQGTHGVGTGNHWRFKCNLGNLPLNAGQYTVSIWFGVKTRDLAKFSSCIQLSIDTGDALSCGIPIPKGWGFFYWQPEWHVQKLTLPISDGKRASES